MGRSGCCQLETVLRETAEGNVDQRRSVRGASRARNENPNRLPQLSRVWVWLGVENVVWER